MKYKIGDLLIDSDGCIGVVCIKYDDGDICSIENDAAHPNPKIIVDGIVAGEDIENIIANSP